MKRWIVPMLCLLLLTGCRSLYPDEYLSVNEHDAPFAYKETTTEPPASTEAPPMYETVLDPFALRARIMQMVSQGVEEERFLLPGYSQEKLESAMQELESTLYSSYPKYTYAMDSFEWQLGSTPAGATVTVQMRLRLTPQEIKSIGTYLFPDHALDMIYSEMTQLASSYIIQVSGYVDTDFVALLEDYILHHPDQMTEIPTIYVGVYPDRGNVRVLEFHFLYSTDRESLRRQRKSVQVQLDSYFDLMSLRESLDDKLYYLYYNLPGGNYRAAENATVYTELVLKQGSSRTMASVVEYLFRRAGEECELVYGQKDGTDWYWNRILVDGQWRYFDLHSAALSKQAPELLPAEALSAYQWDPQRYPEAEAPEEHPAGTTEPAAEPTEVPVQPTEEAAAEPTSQQNPEPLVETEAVSEPGLVTETVTEAVTEAEASAEETHTTAIGPD